MSWRPEVRVGNHWEKNSVVFATKEEAAENARNLFNNWTTADDYRAVETDEPVNYQMVDGRARLVPYPEGEKK
jgi:hypothetical protein